MKNLVYKSDDSKVKVISIKPLDKKSKELVKEVLIEYKDMLDYLKDI